VLKERGRLFRVQMERTVSFIGPGDLAFAVDPDVLYMGDMAQRRQYPDDSNVRSFVSLTRWTEVLAPLLVLSEVPVIHVHCCQGTTSRITISASSPIPDMDEHLDHFLRHASDDILSSRGVAPLYREMLGELATVVETR
jgi:hypothetical protein